MSLPPLVAPIVAQRYAALDRLDSLIAPPYDVISPAERSVLAGQDARNIVHVMLPEGNGDRYTNAARLLGEWRKGGTLIAESGQAVYVLRQEFSTPDGHKHARTGVFAGLAAEGYGPGRVRPHERTHAGPRADRLSLLSATRTVLESIFVLAPDRDGSLRALLRSAVKTPPLARAKLQGVDISFWRVKGDEANKIAVSAGSDRLYIADGHHRFETATAFREQVPSADRTIALIVPLGDPGLVVLPTHRLIRPGRLEQRQVFSLLEPSFDISPVESELDPTAFLAQLGRNRTSALIALPGGRVFAAELKDSAKTAASGVAGKLDVARVDEMIVGPLAKLAGTGAKVDYTADPAVLFSDVGDGLATAGVLLNPTKVSDVLAVADAGEVMPPKSTYFIPKVPSGLLLLEHR